MDLCWQSNVSALNILSRLVIAFLSKEQASLNFMVAVTVCSDVRAQESKIFHCFHFFPVCFHEMMGPDTRILVFWMLRFKPTFSLYPFTFIMKLFSSSLSAIRVVSSAYWRLLMFLPTILIPVCVSSRPAFHMMCFAYTLNKQGDSIQPWCTPFPIWNQYIFHVWF